jgi:hypothetical protein
LRCSKCRIMLLVSRRTQHQVNRCRRPDDQERPYQRGGRRDEEGTWAPGATLTFASTICPRNTEAVAEDTKHRRFSQHVVTG